MSTLSEAEAQTAGQRGRGGEAATRRVKEWGSPETEDERGSHVCECVARGEGEKGGEERERGGGRAARASSKPTQPARSRPNRRLLPRCAQIHTQ